MKAQRSKFKAQGKLKGQSSNHWRARRGFEVWCLLILLSFELSALSFETVFLTPVADTALLQSFPSNNFGAQTFFNSGTTQTYLTNRALMKFDLAAALPTGAKITFAQLSLEVVGQPVDGDAPSSFQLRRMRRDWGEGTKKGNPPTLGAPATAGEANWTYCSPLFTSAKSMPSTPPGAAHSFVVSAKRCVQFASPAVASAPSVGGLPFFVPSPQSRRIRRN